MTADGTWSEPACLPPGRLLVNFKSLHAGARAGNHLAVEDGVIGFLQLYECA
jgi:hypothetical protein